VKSRRAPGQEDTGEQVGGPGKWPKCASRMDSIREDKELTGQWVTPSGSSATQEQTSRKQASTGKQEDVAELETCLGEGPILGMRMCKESTSLSITISM
jgi:hypothetical protein